MVDKIKEEIDSIIIETINKLTKKEIVDFVIKFFEIRDTVHFIHLQTSSNSNHVALNELYSKIIEIIDEFIETYQGQYDIIKRYVDIKINTNIDIINYLTDSVKFINENKMKILNEKDTHLFNILDEIVALIYRTIYKLKYLK